MDFDKQSASDMIATLSTGRVRINNIMRPNTYIVVKGDSLYKIALKLYGNGDRWVDLYEMNMSVLSHPCLLKAGMVLTLQGG